MKRNIKKIVAGSLLAVMVLSTSATPSVIQAGKSTIGIEKKRQKVNSNSHIPQAKKNLINKKLDAKEAIIKNKKTSTAKKTNTTGINKAIENLERKIAIIKENSNIPKAQKDLKIKKLQNKISILKAKANKLSGTSVKTNK